MFKLPPIYYDMVAFQSLLKNTLQSIDHYVAPTDMRRLAYRITLATDASSPLLIT